MTGSSLSSDCLSKLDEGRFTCLMYVAGVADLLVTQQQAIPGSYSEICIPEGEVTLGQLRRVVTAYIREHPEEEHYLAVVIVLSAIREAFPCDN